MVVAFVLPEVCGRLLQVVSRLVAGAMAAAGISNSSDDGGVSDKAHSTVGDVEGKTICCPSGES